MNKENTTEVGTFNGLVSLGGRIALGTIFLMSAVGNKIPNFSGVASYMSSEGVPAASFMLALAIVFLIAGSLSVMSGFKARIGAGLLFIFLVLATYFFHDFWTVEGDAVQAEMIQFMKNLALMGAMLHIIANGAGAWSVDNKFSKS